MQMHKPLGIEFVLAIHQYSSALYIFYIAWSHAQLKDICAEVLKIIYYNRYKTFFLQKNYLQSTQYNLYM